MNDGPDWALSFEIIGIVVAMAFVPLIPLAGWKLEQWWRARKQRGGDGRESADGL
jgi:hypothetical protein